MIAELAAFNAAFGVVKAAISNGRDIANCAKQIGDMIGAEEELKQRGTQKKNSMWSALAGKDTNDFEEFMALEQIREQRKELLQSMQLYGRGGLKEDYLRFEVEARKARRQAAEDMNKSRKKMLELVVGIIAALTGSAVLVTIVWLIGHNQGRW